MSDCFFFWRLGNPFPAQNCPIFLKKKNSFLHEEDLESIKYEEESHSTSCVGIGQLFWKGMEWRCHEAAKCLFANIDRIAIRF